LKELQSDLKLAQIERDRHFIKAPSAGIVLSVDGAVGALVGPTSQLGEFAAESPTEAVTEIDELYADQVQLNQAAFIRKQGAQDTLALGRVVEVAPSLRQKSLFSDEVGKLEDRRVREVKIRLNEGQDNVLYGQRVECVIILKK
jgi:multidrug resistance efflux pump